MLHFSIPDPYPVDDPEMVWALFWQVAWVRLWLAYLEAARSLKYLSVEAIAFHFNFLAVMEADAAYKEFGGPPLGRFNPAIAAETFERGKAARMPSTLGRKKDGPEKHIELLGDYARFVTAPSSYARTQEVFCLAQGCSLSTLARALRWHKRTFGSEFVASEFLTD